MRYMTTTRKPQYTTEKVVKDDGTVVSVCRCSFADMSTLLEIIERLVEAYVMCDGAIGEIISKPDIQADLKSVCSLLPLEQKTKSGEVQYLDFEDISENWEQIIYLFFNGSINKDTREVTEISSPRISQLHFLPFERILRKHIKTKIEKDKEREESEKS